MDEFLFNVVGGTASVRPNIWLLSSDEIPPLLFSVEQAAQLLKVGRDQVYTLIRLGRLRSVKVGASRRVSARALADCVAQLEELEPA